MVDLLAPEFYFPFLGLLFLMLPIIFPFLSPMFLEAVTSSAILEHTSKTASAMLLQNKDWACLKTVNTWRHTYTHPGFSDVSYSQVSLPKTVFAMVTSPCHSDCWGKKAATTSWFIFNSKLSLFYLFILITSSPSPSPTSNPPEAKPMEPPKYFWNRPTCVHLHSHHPNLSHHRWSLDYISGLPLCLSDSRLGLFHILSDWCF